MQAKTPGLTFCEFFAGGGMTRAGLGKKWACVFANDFDFKKSLTYETNWGAGQLVTKDVGKLEVSELPASPDLAWASFPCQDLSLAGMGAGLRGDRSGTFWPFWRLIADANTKARGPQVIVLENVCGTLTSHNGKDFGAIADALATAGYVFGALIVDAALFVPQSRPRLFIVAVASAVEIPARLVSADPSDRWHTRALRAAHERLSETTRRSWVWWRLPAPERRTLRLRDLIEEHPESVDWHTSEETAKLLGMMSALNVKKVQDAKKTGRLMVGAIYKRTRFNDKGVKVQRAEVRFDGIAGCLRTSSGGSSRQLILVVKGNDVRSRLLSSREAARLMGLPDDYQLPSNYNEAYHLLGDGVVVSVVRHIAGHLIEPLATAGVANVHQVA